MFKENSEKTYSKIFLTSVYFVICTFYNRKERYFLYRDFILQLLRQVMLPGLVTVRFNVNKIIIIFKYSCKIKNWNENHNFWRVMRLEWRERDIEMGGRRKCDVQRRGVSWGRIVGQIKSVALSHQQTHNSCYVCSNTYLHQLMSQCHVFRYARTRSPVLHELLLVDPLGVERQSNRFQQFIIFFIVTLTPTQVNT